MRMWQNCRKCSTKLIAIRSKVKRSRGYDSSRPREWRRGGNGATGRNRKTITSGEELDRSVVWFRSSREIKFLDQNWLHRLENRRDFGIQEIWRGGSGRTVISCSIRTRSIRYKSSLDEDLLRDIRSVLFVPIRPRTWDHSLRTFSSTTFPSSSLFCRQRARRRNFPLTLSRFTYPPPPSPPPSRRTFSLSSSVHRPRSLTLSTSHGKSQIRVCLPGTWSPGGYRW